MYNVVSKEKKICRLSFLIPIQIPKQILYTNAVPWVRGSLLLCDV